AGFGLAIYESIQRRRFEHLLPLAYVAVTFVYHASAFVKFMRYFLPIYPFLALFAAYALVWVWQRARVGEMPPATVSRLHGALARLRPTQRGATALAGAVVGGTLIYALAFSAIYSRPHSRVAASRWMFENIPAQSVLANEHWDDWLPIGGLDGTTSYGEGGMFNAVEMPNYDDDTPDKLNRMVDNLAQADYVVLSSNRLSFSIPRLPMRYPMTTRYYQLLLSGQLGFERVAQFTSYPTFLGIQIPDQAAEEAFSVYDHPEVQIFKKTAAFNAEQVRQLLGNGIVWDAVVHLSPRQASAAPSVLSLSPDEQQSYRQAAAWSSAGVNEQSLGNQWPALAWFLILQAVGLLALAPTMVACRRLADRGYILSKAVGLLVVGWGVWIVSSLQIAAFTNVTIIVILALLAAYTWLLPQARQTELFTFVRERWRLLLFEELLFWGCFGVALFVRWLNPDLWHPGLGGEKPMDLAYLTAVVRTPYFPAYDPWFAGSYINYYYFGFVLVGVLSHLTGIVPYVAY
ncbi:MAG TPA: DUF2298 domain-containing protein, partial [Roseiflexaceae bacterium]|nr:DUF2298 domain-containing protein [Roseiflexaceae bacterium]